MGMAVIFVIVLASAASWLVYNLILVPLHIEYLYNIAFILVIASLVQFVEMFLKKAAPALYQALGVFLPLITTNCAVLGVAVLNMQKGYSFIESIFNGIGGAAGFALAIVLFAGTVKESQTTIHLRLSTVSHGSGNRWSDVYRFPGILRSDQTVMQGV